MGEAKPKGRDPDDRQHWLGVGHFYPVTVTQARYSGVYEGGSWVAFYSYPEDLPEEAFADDVTCAGWWSDNENAWYVAVGDLPNEAVAKLQTKVVEEQRRRAANKNA